MRAVYARLLVASNGSISIDEALFLNDEVAETRRRHDIQDEDMRQLDDLEREFLKTWTQDFMSNLANLNFNSQNLLSMMARK